MLKNVPRTPWLFDEENEPDIVERLLQFGLLKFDNERKLPLKSGETTDIYINLRDARDTPEAIRFISDLFTIPLRMIGVRRFVEVPDAVSCFAGPISTTTDIPYLTIREHAKQGRATDAKVIGHAQRGEPVCILDDVITDGASKVVPYRECRRLGLDTRALIVLVDREQDWQGTFDAQGIRMRVWPGMTLHTVRRHLIQTLGVMERCNPRAEEKNPIILALDGKNWNGILPIVDRLRTTGCIIKVNDLLFYEGSRRLLPNLSVYGRVMVDFKGHDIPKTVENTCWRFRECPPWAVTVHGSGGPDMVKAAVKALEGTLTKVLVVTVLTSIDPKTCEEIYVRQPVDQVMKLARFAKDAGAHGLVCSPEEVMELRAGFPEMILVTPGVRSPGADTNDQKRVGTPRVAIENGANYVVMGRQILGASDPVAEVSRVLKEELSIPA